MIHNGDPAAPLCPMPPASDPIPTEPSRARCLALPAGRGPALAQLQTWLHDATLQRRLPAPGPLRLDLGQRPLLAAELQQLGTALAAAGLELVGVASSHAETRVAAAALGLGWEPADPSGPPPATAVQPSDAAAAEPRLTVHEGTLRSGDHLDLAGSVLVLGDVNPGARVTARGHVLVWGQLRGVAHAGSGGDTTARIVALQLRPVQLRIADAVARGPLEPPLQGLAEEASLVDGAIAIRPARPTWPLGR